MKSESKFNNFIQENAFQNAIYKTEIILSRRQCVKQHLLHVDNNDVFHSCFPEV